MEKNKLLRKIEILEFLFELGATEAHECEPINRLKISKEEEKLNKEGDLGKTPEQSVCHSCSNSERSKFAALIENAKTVDELEAICMLSKEFSSSQLSAKMNFSFGNKLAQVMIICEPPGRPEITENVIYSGECGLIFKKMYEAIGLSIKGNNLYVVPVFPWRLSP